MVTTVSSPEPSQATRRHTFAVQVKRLVVAIRDGDEAMVEGAVLALSQSRRYLAPLAFVVGAFVMLFDGMKLLVSNWRLTVIQILPAMWIWLAMLNLKVHVLHGRDFEGWYGPAALAGLRVDDVLVDVDGAPAGATSLDALRRRLRELPAGTVLALRIERGDATFDARLCLADLVAAA